MVERFESDHEWLDYCLSAGIRLAGTCRRESKVEFSGFKPDFGPIASASGTDRPWGVPRAKHDLQDRLKLRDSDLAQHDADPLDRH